LASSAFQRKAYVSIEDCEFQDLSPGKYSDLLYLAHHETLEKVGLGKLHMEFATGSEELP
jgi:hypothetical protein